MYVIDNNNTVFFDIDDTLILQPDSFSSLAIVDSLHPNRFIYRKRHEPMIRLLEEEHAKGSYIVVWSRGGHKWAENVIRALKLEDKVNLIMTKPMVYFDDLPIEKWLPYRVYFEPGTKYK